MKKCTDSTELSDHTYCKNDNCVTTDLDNTVGANIEVTQTPWFEGRRVVELDVLSAAMACTKCNSWLRLTDIVDELRYGLASLLYIRCSNSVCQFVNTVPTGKKSDNKSYDVNSKAYFGNICARLIFPIIIIISPCLISYVYKHIYNLICNLVSIHAVVNFAVVKAPKMIFIGFMIVSFCRSRSEYQMEIVAFLKKNFVETIR